MRLLSVFASLVISSCTSIPDVPVCRQRTPVEGFCTYTISNKDFVINDERPYKGKTWLDIKVEAVYVPVESWGELKKFILKECKKTNKCTKKIPGWENKINFTERKIEK